MLGFVGIQNYDPVTTNYFGLQEYCKGKWIPQSKESVLKEYLEYAIFYVPYYGVQNNSILQNTPERWEQGITYPKFLEKQEGLATICLWVEITHDAWRAQGPNVKNDGVYRVCYNNGDDSYYHALFATQKEALECFQFILDLNFGHSEFHEVLKMFGFWNP